MWPVDKPTISARESFEANISRLRDQELMQRMAGVTSAVVAAANEYDQAADQAQLHNIATSDNVGDQVTTQEMSKLYSDRMARKGSPGRSIYDELKLAAVHGRCPLCGHRDVSTLDHVLPKAHYPAFSVTPNNLIPACSDCNRIKGDTPLTRPEEQYIHPYFDRIQNDLWLKATVRQSSPASVLFVVEPNDRWTPQLGNRVEYHFNRLHLGTLYSVQAGQQLTLIKHQLVGLHQRGGAESVKRHLAETHASYARVQLNYWQTAFYAALSNSNWYCDGGFDH